MFTSTKKTKLVTCSVLFICLILLCYLLVISQLDREHFISATTKKKPAFCFMIYDKISNQDIWETFFKTVDISKYKILVHYKKDTDLGWFNQFKLDKCLDTCWGCYSLVEAQILLAKNALKDSDVTHCIWLSGSCLPMKNFNHIFNYLDTSKSYFNKSPDSQVFPRCDSLLQNKDIDKKYIKKAAMQSIINRKHSSLLIEHSKFIKDKFSTIKIPDEIAFITTLFYLRLENELVLTNNVTFGATTYTCWKDMSNHRDYPDSKKKGQPYSFSYISPEELQKVIQSESLFARKCENGCAGLEPLLRIL